MAAEENGKGPQVEARLWLGLVWEPKVESCSLSIFFPSPGSRRGICFYIGCLPWPLPVVGRRRGAGGGRLSRRCSSFLGAVCCVCVCVCVCVGVGV